MTTTSIPLPARKPAGRRALRSLRRHPTLYLGCAILILLALAALAAPWLA
ncbi:MAG: ABC transporter permease, partial [Achromobacter sp.]|nr:ABC transporter permease [Achromobacter sp.]